MTIKAKDFRVRNHRKVALDKWPTHVKSLCKSPEKYNARLTEHVKKSSALQRLHYASNRYALLLIFQESLLLFGIAPSWTRNGISLGTARGS